MKDGHRICLELVFLVLVFFRLKEYPQYCQHVAAIPHFPEFPHDLIQVCWSCRLLTFAMVLMNGVDSRYVSQQVRLTCLVEGLAIAQGQSLSPCACAKWLSGSVLQGKRDVAPA